MKSFEEFLAEGQIFANHINWETGAKSQGLEVKKETHPSGVGHHFVAKTPEGEMKGHFDPQAQVGKLYK